MVDCPDCEITGLTEDRRHLEAGVRALLHYPSEVTERLAGRSGDRPFGHDMIDMVTTTRKILAVAGFSDQWGVCPTCKGAGQVDDKAIAAAQVLRMALCNCWAGKVQLSAHTETCRYRVEVEAGLKRSGDE